MNEVKSLRRNKRSIAKCKTLRLNNIDAVFFFFQKGGLDVWVYWKTMIKDEIILQYAVLNTYI